MKADCKGKGGYNVAFFVSAVCSSSDVAAADHPQA